MPHAYYTPRSRLFVVAFAHALFVGESLRKDNVDLGSAAVVGTTDALKVLTYNLCWGCMDGNTKDTTGMQHDLKAKCSSKKSTFRGKNLTECAKNMGAGIASYHKAMGGYDFIALQEAKSVDDLQLYARGVKLSSVSYSSSSFALHTLYNEKKFGKYKAAVKGTLKSSSSRPYHILIFDKVKLIFINMVNVHPKGGSNKSWKDWPKEVSKRLQLTFNKNTARKKYRVIIAGDFNDLGGHLPGGLRLPWNHATLNARKPLPRSCCQTKVGSDNKSPGDYIFDSVGMVKSEVPKLYNKKLPQSDHWPVQAFLPGLKQIKPSKRSSARRGSKRRSPKKPSGGGLSIQTLCLGDCDHASVHEVKKHSEDRYVVKTKKIMRVGAGSETAQIGGPVPEGYTFDTLATATLPDGGKRIQLEYNGIKGWLSVASSSGTVVLEKIENSNSDGKEEKKKGRRDSKRGSERKSKRRTSKKRPVFEDADHTHYVVVASKKMRATPSRTFEEVGSTVPAGFAFKVLDSKVLSDSGVKRVKLSYDGQEGWLSVYDDHKILLAGVTEDDISEQKYVVVKRRIRRKSADTDSEVVGSSVPPGYVFKPLDKVETLTETQRIKFKYDGLQGWLSTQDRSKDDVLVQLFTEGESPPRARPLAERQSQMQPEVEKELETLRKQNQDLQEKLKEASKSSSELDPPPELTNGGSSGDSAEEDAEEPADEDADADDEASAEEDHESTENEE